VNTANVYVGLGSNEGDRERHLVRALEALSRIDAVAVLRCSSLFDSAAVGPSQPRFLNAVVALDCGLPPQRLLTILQRIEYDLGRRRDGTRWGARCIDLDILLWEGEVIADANLQVPHLELHKRRFALEPLVELSPDVRHPVLGTSVKELLYRLDPQDVRRLSATQWPEASPLVNDT
jgi:2-amino-4-hydroxy-6-hydroxymethyldihydropteridine diphosphokinase